MYVVTIATSSPDPIGINEMINSFKNVIGYILLYILKYTQATKEACNKEVRRKPRSLAFISDIFKTQEMCNEAVQADPYTLKFVPVHLRTYEMCFKAVEKYLTP